MTLDTSAVLAIMQGENERTEFVSLIEQSARRLISAVSVLEAAMVLEGRRGDDAGADLDIFLQRAAIETVSFDEEQLRVLSHEHAELKPLFLAVCQNAGGHMRLLGQADGVQDVM